MGSPPPSGNESIRVPILKHGGGKGRGFFFGHIAPRLRGVRFSPGKRGAMWPLIHSISRSLSSTHAYDAKSGQLIFHGLNWSQ